MLSWQMLFQALGAVWFLRFARDFAMGVYASFLRGGKDLEAYGEWAIVTGATDGIGKAMAFELAKKNLNVLLISRTQSKLDDVAKELSEKHSGVEVETLAIDFGDFSKEAQANVAEFVAKHDIGVLVNNVGMSYSFPQYFSELSGETVEQLIDLNVISTTKMTHLVLPSMKEAGRGAVVSISSASGRFSSPLLAQYSASKSYVELFSQGLNAELEGSGVHVQVQSPMFVTTKLAKIRKPSITTPTPAGYAKAAVAAIGYECSCTPYWSHKIILYILTSLPAAILNPQANKMHHGLRKRALKKEAEKAKAQ